MGMSYSSEIPWSGWKYPNSLWRWRFTRSRLPDVGVGEAQHSHHSADPPRAAGSRPPGSNSPRRGLVYRLALEAPIFRWIPTRPDFFFLVAQGVSRLHPCAWTLLRKGLVPNSVTFCLVTTDTKQFWIIRTVTKIMSHCWMSAILDSTSFGFGVPLTFCLWEKYFELINVMSPSSSSFRAISTKIPDPLSPLLPIVHRFWQLLRATSCILT